MPSITKKIRTRYKMNQVEFAKVLKISQGYLSKLESDKMLPSLEVAIRLNRIFGVTLRDLNKIYKVVKW